MTVYTQSSLLNQIILYSKNQMQRNENYYFFLKKRNIFLYSKSQMQICNYYYYYFYISIEGVEIGQEKT